MKKSSLILLFSLGALSAFAQQRITLDLQQTIALANDSSLEAFRTKNMYLAGYWAASNPSMHTAILPSDRIST